MNNISHKLHGTPSSLTYKIPSKPAIMLPEQLKLPCSSLFDKLPADCLQALEAQVKLFKELSNDYVSKFDNQLGEGKFFEEEAQELLEHSLLVLLNQKLPVTSVLVNRKVFEVSALFHYNELEQCAKVLKSTLEDAYKAELFNQLDTLLTVKQYLVEHGVVQEKQVDETRLAIIKNKDQLINYQHYECLMLQFEMLMNNNGSRVSHNNQLKKLLTNPYLEDEKAALSMRSKCLFYTMHGLISAQMLDYETAQSYFKKIVDIYDFQLHLIEESAPNTIILYSNIVNVSIGIGRYEEALDYIQKLQNITKQWTHFMHQDIHFDIQLRMLSQKIIIYTAQNHYAKIIQQIPHIKKYLEKSPKSFRINYQHLAIRHIAFAYQALQQKAKAIEWWSLLDEYEHSDINTNLQVIGKMQKIILLIDQKNSQLLEKTVQETKKYYKKNHVKGKYENLFLAMINSILEQQDLNAPKIRTIFQEYLPLLESLVEPVSKRPFNYQLSIINWIKTSITKNTWKENK